MSQCNRLGCQHAGTHYLRIRVWAQNLPKSTAPITITPALQFCRAHAADEVASKALLGDEGWAWIERSIVGQGKSAPDRASAEIISLRGTATDVIHEARRKAMS